MLFRMNHPVSKFYMLALAALFAVVVSGCSSSGGGGDPVSMAPPTTPEPEPELTPAEQLAAANTALATAQAAVTALTSSSTAEEAAAAYGALADARTAVHATTNLPENQIAALQGMIDTLTMNLNTATMIATQYRAVVSAVNSAQTAIDGLTDESTDADVDAANTMVAAARTALTGADALDADDTARLESQVAGVETPISNIQTARADRPDPAMVAATTEAAVTKETEIAKQSEMDAAGLGGTVPDDHMISFSNKDGAALVKITKGTGDSEMEFVKNTMVDLTGKDGSAGSMNVLGPNDNGETEVAIVYTDIQVPTDIPFVMAKGKGRHTLDANPKTPLMMDFRSLYVNMENAGMASADLLSTPTGYGTVTLVGDDNADTEDVKENEFRGTFDDAMGTFTCTTVTGGCMAEIEDGKLTTAGMDGLYFTPDKNVTVSETDSDYLHYGVWLMKTDDKDGTTYNEVQTFAGSSLKGPDDMVTDVRDVMGTASYKGGAAGVYVRNVYLPSTEGEQEVGHATSGHFTAAVDLTAYFSGVDVAMSKMNSIKGTIGDFSLQHGEDASGWRVAVEAGIDVNAAIIGGMARGGGGGNGSFSASFVGNDSKDVEGVNTPIGPKHLVGEFSAEFTNGSVAGGFGTRRQ